MNSIPCRALAAACLLAALVAGCSGGRGNVGSSGPSASSTTTIDPATGQTANPLATNATALPTASPGASEPAIKECRARTIPSQRKGAPPGTYIRAAPTLQNGWGPKCDLLHAGDRCTVKWNGAFLITTDSSGFVEFRVWTDTSREPVHKQEIGPVPDQGQFTRWEFPMTVPRAKEVALEMILKDSHRVPLAISDVFIYPVDCPGTRP